MKLFKVGPIPISTRTLHNAADNFSGVPLHPPEHDKERSDSIDQVTIERNDDEHEDEAADDTPGRAGHELYATDSKSNDQASHVFCQPGQKVNTLSALDPVNQCQCDHNCNHG